MLALMLSILGIGLMRSTSDEVNITGNAVDENMAFYAADAGLEKCASALNDPYTDSMILNHTGTIDDINGFSVIYTARRLDTVGIYVTDKHWLQIDKGCFAGLNGWLEKDEVSSVATCLGSGNQLTLTQGVQGGTIPIVEFCAFSNTDMYITPRTQYTIGTTTLGGRVHANGNLVLACGATGTRNALRIYGPVTASGHIYHDTDLYTQSQPDSIFMYSSMASRLETMYNAGWLDAYNPDWYNEAARRWGGRVADQAFGQDRYELRLNNPSNNAYKIIQRYNDTTGTGGLEDNADVCALAQAGFEILGDGTTLVFRTSYVCGGNDFDTVYENRNGVITRNALPALTLALDTIFYDVRERKWVKAIQVNLDNLRHGTWGASSCGGVVTPGPMDVIFFSDKRPFVPSSATDTIRAVRLTGGANLRTHLSIFSENPVYVFGKYNTGGTVSAVYPAQPALIAADAITLLSPGWNDANSGQPLTSRIATTGDSVRVALIGGLSQPSREYDGLSYKDKKPMPIERMPRFLENWTGKSLFLSASLSSLWMSRIATGGDPTITDAPNICTPPVTYCAYDVNFRTYISDASNIPPNCPQIRFFERTGWKQKSLTYQAFEPGEGQVAAGHGGGGK